MKERPLLMSGPLVLATLADRKTQTRRLPRPGGYGQPGDRLWVRETWAENVPGCEVQGGYSYQADHDDPNGDGPAHPMKWRSPRYMPRRASRLTLEILEVRTEPLQAITEEDARAEGLPWSDEFKGWCGAPGTASTSAKPASPSSPGGSTCMGPSPGTPTRR